ncbi:uncharacterized protein LOC105664918 [Ceratitis capitata]|uniref:(Mediterranean fruit fly) hypothetical protein n=1 Tax=Ceratitis capitata TaxID=7213 RepID=A0A811VFW3_CERCA|nr:uncharacterized protein LOC105664918 [Ceratitis capitata]CAD7014190.1 unnamed protein product [Ceratitis capitata]
MEDKRQRHLQQQQQEQEQEQPSEDMKTILEEAIVTTVGVSTDDSSSCMSVQEAENELESIETAFETDYQKYQSQAKSKHQHSHNQALGQYSPKKSVSFKTLVDIFQMSDAWQLHVKKSNLKTEEDQAKRRILQRNY